MNTLSKRNLLTVLMCAALGVLAASAYGLQPREEYNPPKPGPTAKPPQPPQPLPDITTRRLGMEFGVNPGGGGGLFAFWSGSVSLTEANSFERAGLPGYCAFRVSYDVVNVGGAPTGRAFTNRFRRGTTLASVHTLPALAAGEARIPIITVLVFPAGMHQLSLSLDDDRVVAESNERNIRTVQVLVGGKCP